MSWRQSPMAIAFLILCALVLLGGIFGCGEGAHLPTPEGKANLVAAEVSVLGDVWTVYRTSDEKFPFIICYAHSRGGISCVDTAPKTCKEPR